MSSHQSFGNKPQKPEASHVAPLSNLAGKLNLDHNRILVVDDNDKNREVLVELLSVLGVTSVAAGNGREALDALQRSADFDCIIIDNHMPVMDGTEATRRIREQPA